jgi:hypothetical protein
MHERMNEELRLTMRSQTSHALHEGDTLRTTMRLQSPAGQYTARKPGEIRVRDVMHCGLQSSTDCLYPYLPI